MNEVAIVLDLVLESNYQLKYSNSSIEVIKFSIEWSNCPVSTVEPIDVCNPKEILFGTGLIS